MIHLKNIHRVIAYNLTKCLFKHNLEMYIVTRFKVVKVHTIKSPENRDQLWPNTSFHNNRVLLYDLLTCYTLD